jgi:hypothetical protein
MVVQALDDHVLIFDPAQSHQGERNTRGSAPSFSFFPTPSIPRNHLAWRSFLHAADLTN